MLAKVIFFSGVGAIALAVLLLIFSDDDGKLGRYSVLAAIGFVAVLSVIIAAIITWL